MSESLHHIITDLVENVDSENLDRYMDVALDLFDDKECDQLFELIELIVGKYSKEREKNEDAYFCSLAVFSAAMTFLAKYVRKEEEWASELSEDVQEMLAETVFNADQDEEFQADILSLISSSGLELSDDFKEANLELFDQLAADFSSEDLDCQELFTDLIETGLTCPFEVIDILQSQLQVLPVEAHVMMIHEMAQSEFPAIREAAVLMLLHSDPKVRQEAPAVLKQYLGKNVFSPISLRRMIGVRNWLPHAERPPVDLLIREVRESGIECAPWPSAEKIEVFSQEFEEHGTEGIAIVADVEKKKHFISILADNDSGFSQCLVEDDLKPTEIEALLSDLIEVKDECRIDIDELNESIPFYLGVTLEDDETPPVSLLKVAELVGVSDWYPEFADA